MTRIDIMFIDIIFSNYYRDEFIGKFYSSDITIDPFIVHLVADIRMGYTLPCSAESMHV